MKLHAKGKVLGSFEQVVIARVTTSSIEEQAARGDYCVLVKSDPDGFGNDFADYAGLVTSCPETAWRDSMRSLEIPAIFSAPNLDGLTDGDIVALDPSGFIRILYRRNSPHNAIFATDRCNSFCLMCSQPPKNIDDSDRIWEHHRLIDLIDPETRELGITGGEPTLLKRDFLSLISHCKDKLPNTALHVLTNGRLFYYARFAEQLAAIGHPDLMLGIPLYSDINYEHDFVVQARGAFEQTMLGLHNLARYGVKVEIRVVIHKLTWERLSQLSEYIYRNLPFAAHVALMGMEMVGFVHQNMDQLWIDPYDYRKELEVATNYLAIRGMNVSIYNHQLCVLPRSVWPFARKSISDWKNIYLQECQKCTAVSFCGGFFQSGSKRHSAHIHAITEVTP